MKSKQLRVWFAPVLATALFILFPGCGSDESAATFTFSGKLSSVVAREGAVRKTITDVPLQYQNFRD